MNSDTQDTRNTQGETAKDVAASKTTTVSVSTLVSGLSKLVQGNVGASSHPGVVTAFISSSTSSKIASVVAKPLLVGSQTLNQPLLLPKPNINQKRPIPSTPPKVNYVGGQALLNSPLHASPSHSWHPASPYNRKRTLQDGEVETSESKRRRTPNRCTNEKGGKGLRHFSMKVCEKVQQKGVTTYNEVILICCLPHYIRLFKRFEDDCKLTKFAEVADELVHEFSDKNDGHGTEQSYDQKNIRRRVYDALNVLKAMNIITNEKKEIRWVGLPTNSAQECKHLEEQKSERSERIRQKMQQLKELIVQQIAFKNLVERNKRVEKTSGAPPPNACIHLPFIIVNTSKKTVIDCSISSDKSEYLFNFDEAFEIHDDIEVLKRMGLSLGLEKGECSESDLTTARKMVPKVLEPYVIQMAKGTYGNPELIKFEGSNNHFSPLSFPNVDDRQGPSSSNTERSAVSLRPQLPSASHRTSLRTSSALSAASDYDSENEGDDERTITDP